MKKYSIAVLIGFFLLAGLFFTNGALQGQDDTKMIGGPANPSAQTGWWSSIPYHFGVQHVDKADMTQIEAKNVAQMKVVDPTKLQAKGFPAIKAGDMVQVKRVNDKQAKIKLLPNGPEKTISITGTN
jgi:hypothetical protein